MDLATIIGIIGAMGLIVASMIMGGGVQMFVDMPSVMIVFGGTIMCTLTAKTMGQSLSAFKVAMNAFFVRVRSPDEITKAIQEIAAKVRKEGLLAAEGMQVSDPFLQKALRLAVDGVPSETIQATLRVELAAMKERHSTGQKVFKFMAATGPSMGMIGTLIGLVQMLQNLSDPSSIGPAMAVALLTTLYGALLAYVVCIPIADKLEDRTRVESRNMRLVIDGIEAIVKGENALIIKEKLAALLAPNERAQSGLTDEQAA